MKLICYEFIWYVCKNFVVKYLNFKVLIWLYIRIV